MEPDLEANLTTSQSQAPAGIRPETIVFACILAAALVFAGIVLVVYPRDTLLPTFSVDLAGFDVIGDGSPAMNATFDLALHGATRRRMFRTLGICNERGTVAVSYGGAVLAWGRVPKFCVPAQGQEHVVRMVAIGGDVELSDELRGRMDSERRSRTLELDVDIMLDRQRYLSCRVKLDEASPQPSPCKVLVLD